MKHYYKRGMARTFSDSALRVVEALSHRYGMRLDELCERRAAVDPDYAILMGFEPEEEEEEAWVEEVPPCPDTERFIIAARLGRVGRVTHSVRPEGRRYHAYSL